MVWKVIAKWKKYNADEVKRKIINYKISLFETHFDSIIITQRFCKYK